jgi:hypothetical protein
MPRISGQQAMALAFIYPEPEKGGRGRKSNRSETEQFSKVRLSDARSVLRHSRRLSCVHASVLVTVTRIGSKRWAMRLRSLPHRSPAVHQRAAMPVVFIDCCGTALVGAELPSAASCHPTLEFIACKSQWMCKLVAPSLASASA